MGVLGHAKTFFKNNGINGQVTIGGSFAMGENGPDSDMDIYLILDSWRDLINLLRQKKQFKDFALSKFRNLDIQYILVTKWLMKKGLFYVYAVDEKGELCFSPLYPRIILNNALKVAYQELALANYAAEKNAYHLSKAMLFGLYALGISKNKKEFLQPPIFSSRTAIEQVGKLVSISDISNCIKILDLKFTSLGTLVQPGSLALVRNIIDKAYEQIKKRSTFSLYSYLLYNIFALKKGRFNYLFCNPDRVIIDKWIKIMNVGDIKKVEELKNETCPVLII